MVLLKLFILALVVSDARRLDLGKARAILNAPEPAKPPAAPASPEATPTRPEESSPPETIGTELTRQTSARPDPAMSSTGSEDQAEAMSQMQVSGEHTADGSPEADEQAADAAEAAKMVAVEKICCCPVDLMNSEDQGCEFLEPTTMSVSQFGQPCSLPRHPSMDARQIAELDTPHWQMCVSHSQVQKDASDTKAKKPPQAPGTTTETNSLTNIVAHSPVTGSDSAVIVGAPYDSRPFDGAAPGAEDSLHLSQQQPPVPLQQQTPQVQAEKTPELLEAARVAVERGQKARQAVEEEDFIPYDRAAGVQGVEGFTLKPGPSGKGYYKDSEKSVPAWKAESSEFRAAILSAKDRGAAKPAAQEAWNAPAMANVSQEAPETAKEEDFIPYDPKKAGGGLPYDFVAARHIEGFTFHKKGPKGMGFYKDAASDKVDQWAAWHEKKEAAREQETAKLSKDVKAAAEKLAATARAEDKGAAKPAAPEATAEAKASQEDPLDKETFHVVEPVQQQAANTEGSMRLIYLMQAAAAARATSEAKKKDEPKNGAIAKNGALCAIAVLLVMAGAE